MASLMPILLTFSLFFSTLFFPSFSELCNPADKKTLLKIKKDFNNPYHLASWDPNTDCCTWYCVACDHKTHRINSLNIFSGEVSGPIPAAVGQLQYLETLEFHKLPFLTGPIPPSIVNLKNLKHLDISWTNLSGPIPEFLSQLKKLTFLYLSFNKFSGSIPSSLSQVPNLEELHLDRNKLTGPIPNSFGHFEGKIRSLYLSHNQLSGKIPASLGNMDFSSSVDLQRNKLEGDASMLFGSKKSTQFIYLSRNLLQFDLSKVEMPKNLIGLDLSHNKIYGSLPAGMASMAHLQNFNVSYNRLCGKIPVGGSMQRFEIQSYFHNKCLCGAPLSKCK